MEHEVKKSWFRRNWLWFIPSLGCLTLIIFVIVGIAGVFTLINNAEPTQFALEKASKDQRVISILGEPIEKYSISSGKMSYSSNSGSHVDLIIPIRGPKGNASLVIKGNEEDGVWIYEKLYVLIKENNEKINLLDKNLEGI